MWSSALFTPTFQYFYTDISAISVTFRNSDNTISNELLGFHPTTSAHFRGFIGTFSFWWQVSQLQPPTLLDTYQLSAEPILHQIKPTTQFTITINAYILHQAMYQRNGQSCKSFPID